jgi:cell fate regulator YaaT (PSP1 superfamily)
MEKLRFRVHLRYGEMRLYGDFLAEDTSLRKGDVCVVTSERGVEIGEVVVPPRREPESSSTVFHGEILRPASETDLKKARPFGSTADSEEYRSCRDLIIEHELPMRLVGVEHLFGGGKLIFYFVAENRIDFRGLVRDLAKEHRARIELKQIGVRDEAKLLGCMNNCGRTLCCRNHLKSFAPVTMKMAKNQQLPLDPARISGRCGRLKCCLRYEDEAYDALRRLLPRKGSTLATEHGSGKVVDREILAQRVMVALPNGKRVLITCSSSTTATQDETDENRQ